MVRPCNARDRKGGGGLRGEAAGWRTRAGCKQEACYRRHTLLAIPAHPGACLTQEASTEDLHRAERKHRTEKQGVGRTWTSTDEGTMQWPMLAVMLLANGDDRWSARLARGPCMGRTGGAAGDC